MTLSFRHSFLRSQAVTKWLRDRIGKTVAFRVLYTIALVADVGVQHAHEAIYARYPGFGTPTALPYIGRDRRVPRGFNESDASYAGRLVNWLIYHLRAGNPFGIMREVRDYLAPFKPRMRIVNESGTWYTLEPDDTETVHQTFVSSIADSNWSWDGDGTKTVRCALIIYSDQGPFTKGRKWGDGWRWGDGRTWGTSATPEQVKSIRAIVKLRKNSGDLFESIIIAFDPASFDPTSPTGTAGLPNGVWGKWSHLVGGAIEPVRLSTARYWAKVA